MPLILSSQTRFPDSSMSDATQLLSAAEQGDPKAAEELLPLVYEELRKLAATKLTEEYKVVNW